MEDPRGPLRTITAVQETASSTMVTKDCGHISPYNQIFHYTVGAQIHCFSCGPHGKLAEVAA